MSWDPTTDQNRKDPDTLTEYPEWLFEVLYAWRDVAIDNHVQDGENLDGLTEHVTGVVDTQSLLNNYDLPIVMSFPGQHNPGAGTLSTDQGTLAITAVVYDHDLHTTTALEDAMEYAGTIVSNVENDPTLTAGGDTDRAKVAACRLTNFSPDFEENPPPDRAPLKWCAASFTCDLKRRYGHST